MPRAKAACLHVGVAVSVAVAWLAADVTAGGAQGFPGSSRATTPAVAPALFSYAAATTTGLLSCPLTAVVDQECTLGEALALVEPGQVVALATPGADAHYTGNWVVATAGTSAAEPVTIEPAPGTAAPELDGNEGKALGCSTGVCDGPVLTLGQGVNVDIDDLVFANADNRTTGRGGGIDNHGGTMLVEASSFDDNSAADGAAIDNADCSDAAATITGSTFQSNTATSGGAIDNGDAGPGPCETALGTLTVRSSSFSGNQAGDGGAIDSGDGGDGRLFIDGSDFSDNKASNGGAIDSADDGPSGEGRNGHGSLTVSASSFTDNTADGEGGAINVGLNSNAAIGDSTFFANTVHGDGGAVDNDGELDLSESTLVGNSAQFNGNPFGGDGMGGAVANSRRLVVWASTFSLNEAAGLGPELESGQPVQTGLLPSGTVWLAADIINGPCAIVAGWDDAGYNVAVPNCLKGAPGDVAPPDLARLLGPLAAHGGPTGTVLPLEGNPAIGAVPSGTTADLDGTKVGLCPTTDQRGQASSPGQACDAGSVQLGATPPPPAPPAVTVLYAYAGTKTLHLTACPQTPAPAQQCTLAEALALAVPGTTVALATPGSVASYVGSWSVRTWSTSARHPVTIEPAPGVSRPALSGKGTQGSAAMVTLGGRLYLTVKDIAFNNALNFYAATSEGGAISVPAGSTLTVVDCTFNDDIAEQEEQVGLAGPYFLGGDGGAIYNQGTLSVSGSTFSGDVSISGGAIASSGPVATVVGSRFTGNVAGEPLSGTANPDDFSGEGGAIDNEAGSFSISGSTFYQNEAEDYGSVAGQFGYPSAKGGAIENSGGAGTSLTISTSSFDDNEAHLTGGAIDNEGQGGPAKLVIMRSTFRGNFSGGPGGAITDAGLKGNGTVVVSTSTFSGNSQGSGATVSVSAGAEVAVSASTFTPSGGAAALSGVRGARVWVAADIFGGTCERNNATWIDRGRNVATGPSCFNGGQGDIARTVDLVDPMAANGGPTETALPTATSPAIGAVPYGTSADLAGARTVLCPTVDQRGVRSAPGKACDAGSVQLTATG